jgi:4-hydroxythreonine-4-phosphate dehydrogenase
MRTGGHDPLRQRVRLIADDLTGAADAGVAFARPERPVSLLLHAEDAAWEAAASGTVTAVDADTRDGSATAAHALVTRLAAHVRGDDILLKKIDSTLRGHVAVELDALRAALPDRLVVVAPAFPAAGRRTRGGVQFVEDAPLHESGAWAAEPAAPPRSVRELLAALDAVEVGRDGTGLPDAGGRVAICDAETDEDLGALVRAATATGRPITWVGSGGLAAALARELLPGEPVAPAVAGTPFVVIVGSSAEASRDQAKALYSAGAQWVALPADALAEGDGALIGELAASVADLATTQGTVVSIAGEVDGSLRTAVCRGLATVTAGLARSAQVLVLTGGATARAVLSARGVGSLELLGELAPGIVVARPDDDARTRVVTKAGAFGDGQALVRVMAGGRVT